MRMYVERRMPLGDQRLLTYMSQFLAVGWQLSYEARDQFAMGLMARGLMMTEQMSIDSGRCQFGWLLAAMPDPNLQAISMNKRRIGLTPYAKLAAAPWIAGNIAYLRDLDYLESRLKNPKGEKAEKEASTEDTSGPKKPWKTKEARESERGWKGGFDRVHRLVNAQVLPEAMHQQFDQGDGSFRAALDPRANDPLSFGQDASKLPSLSCVNLDGVEIEKSWNDRS